MLHGDVPTHTITRSQRAEPGRQSAPLSPEQNRQSAPRSTVPVAPGGDAEAAQVIAERVRERLRAAGIDPHRTPQEAEQVVTDETRRWDDLAPALGIRPLRDAAAAARLALALVSGYGALQPYLDDPEVEELWINAPDRIFVARGGRAERIDVQLTSGEVRDLVERMLHATGRRVDLSQPFVDASLPDGSRLHVIIPDIARAHWAVNIRRFHARYRDLSALVAGGMLEPAVADVLVDAVRRGESVLVSGATHTGKTTLLGALLGVLAPATRLVTVEETFELSVELPDVVALQGRQPSLEGTGEVTLRRLVKEALRMRPDRLVIGEVRGEEAFDLVLALNTGVPGACTIHANSAGDALVRLGSLPLLAGQNIDRDFLVPAIARSIGYVVHCELGPAGARRVREVLRLTGEVRGESIVTESVFEGSVA